VCRKPAKGSTILEDLFEAAAGSEKEPPMWEIKGHLKPGRWRKVLNSLRGSCPPVGRIPKKEGKRSGGGRVRIERLMTNYDYLLFGRTANRGEGDV